MICAEIERVPWAANYAMRAHWACRQRDRNDWRIRVRAALGRGRADRPLCLLVAVHRPRRVQDHDNRVASLKHLVDALVHWRWLVDDSPEHLLQLYSAEIARSPPRTWIAIDVDAAALRTLLHRFHEEKPWT